MVYRKAVKVNLDLCTGCNKCAEVCLMQVLKVNEKTKKVEIVQIDKCIDCSDCTMICPEEAITLFGQPLDESEYNVERDGPVLTNMKMRRSIREFKDEALPKETIMRLLSVSKYAPSCLNFRQTHFTVLSRTTINRISTQVADWFLTQPHFAHMGKLMKGGYDAVFHNAPHFVVSSCPVNTFPLDVDATIATTTIQLYATDQGYATYWCGFFMTVLAGAPHILAELHLPQNHKVTGAFGLGIPAIKFERGPQRLNLVEGEDVEFV